MQIELNYWSYDQLLENCLMNHNVQENQNPTGEIEDSLLNFLAEFVSEHKKKRMQEVLDSRTFYITIALEDIYQSQNASATLRTCECLGVQNIHLIESRNLYTLNPDVVMGANKWLSLHYYGDQTEEHATRNTHDCISSLRQQGYRIVATTPHQDAYTPDTIPLDRPLALLFGSEEPGLTQTAMQEADSFLRLPMFGFTESYNISVSVALILNTLTHRLHNSGIQWQLTRSQRKKILLEWYRRTVRRHADLEKQFYARKQ